MFNWTSVPILIQQDWGPWHPWPFSENPRYSTDIKHNRCKIYISEILTLRRLARSKTTWRNMQLRQLHSTPMRLTYTQYVPSWVWQPSSVHDDCSMLSHLPLLVSDNLLSTPRKLEPPTLPVVVVPKRAHFLVELNTLEESTTLSNSDSHLPLLLEVSPSFSRKQLWSGPCLQILLFA